MLSKAVTEYNRFILTQNVSIILPLSPNLAAPQRRLVPGNQPM